MYLHTLLATGLVGIAVSTAASIPTAQNAPFSVAKSHEILLPDGYVSELSSERVCTGADCDSSSTPYLSLNVSVRNDELFVNNERIFPPTTPPRLHALRKWRSDSDQRAERVVLTYALEVRPVAIDEISSTTEDGWIVSIEFFDMHARRATPNVLRVDMGRGSKGLIGISRITIHPLHVDRWGGRPEKYPWEAKYWRTEADGRNAINECTSGTCNAEKSSTRGPNAGSKKSSSVSRYHPAHILNNHYVSVEAIRQWQESAGLGSMEFIPPVLISLFLGAGCVLAALLIGMTARTCLRGRIDGKNGKLRNCKVKSKPNWELDSFSTLEKKPCLEEQVDSTVASYHRGDKGE